MDNVCMISVNKVILSIYPIPLEKKVQLTGQDY